MNNKKKLQEKKGALLRDLQALAEKETLTAEEQASFNAKTEEVTSINQQLANLQNVAEMLAAHQGQMPDESQQREIRRNFDLASFMRAGREGASDGFFAEMQQEAHREARTAGITLDGRERTILIPMVAQRTPMYRNDMTVGTPTAGGNAVATELRSWIDMLTERLVLAQLGASFMPGLIGNVSFPKETAVPTFTWEGETDENAESNPTVGTVSLSPKRGGTFIDVSNQLLLQTSPSVAARITSQLLGAVQRGIESAAISGPGTGGAPTGILATLGIGDVAGGTHGLAPAWSHLVNLEGEVAVDNADIGQLGYLTNTKVRSKLKQTSKVSGQNGFIWDPDNTVNGYQVGVTNLVPSNLTKGDANGVCSAIIFGNFADLLIGQWGPIEILPNPYTKGKSGMTEMIVNVYVDVAIARAQSFAAMKDALTT